MKRLMLLNKDGRFNKVLVEDGEVKSDMSITTLRKLETKASKGLEANEVDSDVFLYMKSVKTSVSSFSGKYNDFNDLLDNVYVIQMKYYVNGEILVELFVEFFTEAMHKSLRAKDYEEYLYKITYDLINTTLSQDLAEIWCDGVVRNYNDINLRL